MGKQKKQLRIGLAGLGNVGAGVYKNLDKNQFLLNERTGTELIVKKIAVRNPDRKRDVEVPSEILTTSWQDLVNDPEIDIIVELIGGVDEAFNLIAAALEANKVVVTGNKAVLAERGKELIEISEKQNTPLYCEAAVAGGIPIIKAVKEALIGNRITAIFGIINGTSNSMFPASLRFNCLIMLPLLSIIALNPLFVDLMKKVLFSIDLKIDLAKC